MTKYKIIKPDGDDRIFDSEDEFHDVQSLLDTGNVDYKTETIEEEKGTESATPNGGSKPEGKTDKNGDNSTPTLQEDPIRYLREINDEYVNKIKGTPAISKRGFRYIQAELDISTKSELVGWSEDPYGVVIWAKAELPDGRSAEAHAEGYPTESGIDESEFVRYADTRAKSRALSDLTSAGALAVDEVRGGIND